MTGSFTISLDLELYWGVRDKRSLASYSANLLGVRRAVPAMLRSFVAHGVNATWAAVGLLLFDNRSDLMDHLPTIRPDYRRRELSPYPDLTSVGHGEDDDPFHYGRSLVCQVVETPGMELATHTFSHYYCLEEGPDDEAFEADLLAALTASEDSVGLRPTSLVFPRNQYDATALDVCRRVGLTAFRGNPSSWPYRPSRDGDETASRRAARLVDAYLPLTRVATYAPAGVARPVDVSASRFLRPYDPRFGRLEPLKLRRVISAMTRAAQTGNGFHLWWHPHNFGRHLDENLQGLEQVLRHYRTLADRYGMRSVTMAEAARG